MKMHFISYMNMNIVVIAQVFELFSKIIQNNNIENQEHMAPEKM